MPPSRKPLQDSAGCHHGMRQSETHESRLTNTVKSTPPHSSFIPWLSQALLSRKRNAKALHTRPSARVHNANSANHKPRPSVRLLHLAPAKPRGAHPAPSLFAPAVFRFYHFSESDNYNCGNNGQDQQQQQQQQQQQHQRQRHESQLQVQLLLLLPLLRLYGYDYDDGDCCYVLQLPTPLLLRDYCYNHHRTAAVDSNATATYYRPVLLSIATTTCLVQ